MSTIKVSTISPLGTDATKTITIGSAGDTIAGMGANTPAFSANNSSTDQTVSDETTTKINLGTEVFDTDSAFDTSNSRFTVPTGKGGKYLINWSIDFLGTSNDMYSISGYVYKNGSVIHTEGFNANSNSNAQFRRYKVDGSVVLVLSAGDYLELYTYVNTNGGGTVTAKSDEKATFFEGQRLIGV